MQGGSRKKKVINSDNSSVEQQGGIAKIKLEEGQTISTEKDESIESTATNNDNILEQQQNITARDVIGEEDSISKEILIKMSKNKRETVLTGQDEDLIESDSNTKSLNKDIEQENQASVDNPQVDQASDFSELSFFEHSEFSDTKAVSDDTHTKLDNNTDDDTSDNELEDSLEPKGEERTLEKGDELIQSRISEDKVENISLKLQNTDDEDLNANDTSKLDPKEEENEHEVEKNIKAQSRKESLSDGESLIDSTPDSSTPHTKTSRMSKDSSILSDHNSPKKKVSKSPFANFSKGEKALLLFVELSSATFIASLISSALGKPLCPDEKGNLISLAILGTVAIVSITVSLAHFYCSNKSKEESLPLNTFGDSEVVPVLADKKRV